MSHRVAFLFTSDQHLTHSQTKEKHLRQIYYTSLFDRPTEEIYMKFALVFIGTLGLIKAFVIIYKMFFKKVSRDFFLIIFVLTEIAVFTSYLSFIFISRSRNNVFRTVPLLGTKECPSLQQVRLEIVRYIVFSLSENFLRWLALVVAFSNVNHRFTIRVLLWFKQSCAVKKCKFMTVKFFFGLLCLLFFVVYSATFAFIKIQSYENPSSYETCYQWFSVAFRSNGDGELFSAFFLELLPYVSLMICLGFSYYMNRSSTNGSSVLSSMHIWHQGFDKDTKQFDKHVIRIVIIDLVMTLPHIIRHFLMSAHIYEPASYKFDEMVCDRFDGLLLLNTGFVVMVYYHLVHTLDQCHKARIFFGLDDATVSTDEIHLLDTFKEFFARENNVTLKDLKSITNDQENFDTIFTKSQDVHNAQ